MIILNSGQKNLALIPNTRCGTARLKLEEVLLKDWWWQIGNEWCLALYLISQGIADLSSSLGPSSRGLPIWLPNQLHLVQFLSTPLGIPPRVLDSSNPGPRDKGPERISVFAHLRFACARFLLENLSISWCFKARNTCSLQGRALPLPSGVRLWWWDKFHYNVVILT